MYSRQCSTSPNEKIQIKFQQMNFLWESDTPENDLTARSWDRKHNRLRYTPFVATKH